jgi:hypothetical protein
MVDIPLHIFLTLSLCASVGCRQTTPPKNKWYLGRLFQQERIYPTFRKVGMSIAIPFWISSCNSVGIFNQESGVFDPSVNPTGVVPAEAVS